MSVEMFIDYLINVKFTSSAYCLQVSNILFSELTSFEQFIP